MRQPDRRGKIKIKKRSLSQSLHRPSAALNLTNPMSPTLSRTLKDQAGPSLSTRHFDAAFAMVFEKLDIGLDH
jgi:hypothetical protein